MNKYQTVLTPTQEIQFQSSPFASQVTSDYDMRGAWLAMQQGLYNYQGGHYTDDWKTPYHPTFSTGSIYNGRDGYYGGSWYKLIPNIPDNQYKGPWLYMVNPTNTFSPPALRDYWERVEPGNVLWDAGVRW